VQLARRKLLLLIVLTGCFVFALPTLRNAATIEEEISQIEDWLADADREIEQLDPRIEKCDRLGYYRQKQWWELSRQVAEEAREKLRLCKQRLELQEAGEPVPEALTQRLAELERKEQARQLDPRRAEQATAAWQQVDTRLYGICPNYSWHLVKLNLLRDLIHRTRRIRFYLQEAMRPAEGGYGGTPLPAVDTQHRLAQLLLKDDPAQFELGPVLGMADGHSPIMIELDELLEETHSWVTQWGDIFFSRRETQLLGQAEQAEALVLRTEQLEVRLAELEAEREALTQATLEFLRAFDREGKFESLGIPYRNAEVKLSADGTPNQLLFCTIAGAGHGGPDRKQEDPLCFDVVDFFFYSQNLTFRAPGVLDLEAPSLQGRLASLASDVEAGFLVKQSVNVQYGTLMHLLGKWEDHTPDEVEALYLANSAGDRSGTGNIWHPTIRERHTANLAAVARFCKQLPNFLIYDKLTWEPFGLWVAGDSSDSPHEGGYNPEAQVAFRAYLHDKFGDIERLNEAWRTNYTDFASIAPPADAYVVTRRRASPLSHEFELFRMQSWIDHLTMCVQAIQKEDPDHPIVVEVPTLTAHFGTGMPAAYRMMTQIPAQLIEDHYNAWAGSYSDLNLLYSLCLYAGKVPVESEYIWTYPRLISVHTEDQFRVTGELSIWRKMVWGRKVLNVFGTFAGWGYRHNYMDEAYCELGPTLGPTGSLVREAGVAIPMGKKRAREFWPYLADTEVVKPRIAVLVPTTSIINEYPYHTPFAAYSTINTELIRFERFLTPRDLDFRFIPEEVVVSGEEDLSAFRAIIVPYAPYFPPGLADKLLQWTKAGGTLIASGVVGLYDPYGFDDPALLNSVFGRGLRHRYAGDDKNWKWNLHVRQGDDSITIMVRDDRRPILVSARYGQGRVLLSGQAITSTPHQQQLQAVLVRELADAIGCPTAYSDHHRFELVTREGNEGQRYLFITNPNLDEVAVDYVTVEGEYPRVIDLGIGSHCQVPLAPRKPMAVNSRYYTTSQDTGGSTFVSVVSPRGRTTFQMHLAPGEGTVLKLVK